MMFTLEQQLKLAKALVGHHAYPKQSHHAGVYGVVLRVFAYEPWDFNKLGAKVVACEVLVCLIDNKREEYTQIWLLDEFTLSPPPSGTPDV